MAEPAEPLEITPGFAVVTHSGILSNRTRDNLRAELEGRLGFPVIILEEGMTLKVHSREP